MNRLPKGRAGLLLFCLLLPVGFLFFLFRIVTPALPQTAVAQTPVQPIPGADKFDAALRAALTEHQPGADELLRVIVHLQGQASLNATQPTSNLIAAREQIIARLQETADSAAAPLQPELTALQQAGAVSAVRPLWIINALSLHATPVALAQLAENTAVSHITLDPPRDYLEPPIAELDTPLAAVSTAITTLLKSWGLAQINAPHVWHGLGVDGDGVTVAIMDSGVDWQHPDLLPNYRGNLGGVYDHSASWYYPVSPTITAPVDFFGHGTHVAGTAVGQNGIGVAPGARWMAVGLTDEGGLIFDSDIHAGFQWLLAPNGDPALAPDVVNNSWGSESERITFLPDINALHAAGIITVFSAGNAGPSSHSLGVPAAYTDTLAVGATDDADRLTWFSSRGPSRLTTAVKPEIVAPGAAIYSALPGGQYGYASGTSMAAPHTTGAIALLLAANPTLNRPQVIDNLTLTAVHIDPPHPNHDTGWGRLDALAAVKLHVTTGRLQGTIRSGGVPLPGVPVTITNAAGGSFVITADAAGFYQADLKPGSYTLSVTRFGSEPQSNLPVIIAANQVQTRHVDLTPLPQGTISGAVRESGSDRPIAGAIVSALHTPVSAVTDENGRYTLSLPPAQYKLTVSASGYRLGRAVVIIQESTPASRDFSLATAPRILVVDNSEWQFRPLGHYYHEALATLNYSFDTWAIRHPGEDALQLSNLAPYDAVIWADPSYSPGVIDANDVLTDYLGLGGNLLISGQNVGAYDGSFFSAQYWWTRQLRGLLQEKITPDQPINGVPETSFSHISLTLNGGSGANNQRGIDISRPLANSVTEPIFSLPNGGHVGLQAGRCQPYRIVYLGFGLEGVSDAADRTALIQSSFDYFDSPRITQGARWEEKPVNAFALPGDEFVYTVTVRNMSETITDTFAVHVSSEAWPTTVVTPTLTLGPCGEGETAVRITVPPDAAQDSFHTVTVTAVSSQTSAATRPLTMTHKTPGQILLVDDDRWYDAEDAYKTQLDQMGLGYDVWETGWRSGQQMGSPPTALLNAYDFVIWFTGYDWFAPVTPVERASLAAFLEQGGRLFLSSQDFMYYHRQTPLARDYLGVVDYRESITPTAVLGNPSTLIGPSLPGPLPLTYGPYQNFSDGLVPAADSDALLWSNAGMPAAVASSGPAWRTVFLGFPFETLPETARPAAMNRMMGWLSDLGDSTFEVDAAGGAAGETRTYTITVRNAAVAPKNEVTVTNPLPPELTLVPGSLQGAVYNAAAHTIEWAGVLPAGSAHRIVYQATADATLAAGSFIENGVTLGYTRHNLAFDLAAGTWAGAPDLTKSAITAVPNHPFGATAVTYTLSLINDGPAAAATLSATLYLPALLHPITPTLTTGHGAAQLQPGRLLWQGALEAGERVTATLLLTRTASALPQWLPTAVVIQDGVTQTTLREHRLLLNPYSHYLPYVAQHAVLGLPENAD